MKYLRHFLLLLLLLNSCSNETTFNTTSSTSVNSDDIQRIDVPFREYGYAQHPSQLFSSQESVDTFLAKIADESAWNNKTDFLAQFETLDIDFKNYHLLFYRLTESSGSVKLEVLEEEITKKSDAITIPIKREVPEIGTADMAYYALAYQVSKTINSVTFDDGFQKVRIRNLPSDMIIPENCEAWFDGCNNCSKEGVCTERACLVHRPQDFRCTKWEE